MRSNTSIIWNNAYLTTAIPASHANRALRCHGCNSTFKAYELELKKAIDVECVSAWIELNEECFVLQCPHCKCTCKSNKDVMDALKLMYVFRIN